MKMLKPKFLIFLLSGWRFLNLIKSLGSCSIFFLSFIFIKETLKIVFFSNIALKNKLFFSSIDKKKVWMKENCGLDFRTKMAIILICFQIS